jgi:hypothetical protein
MLSAQELAAMRKETDYDGQSPLGPHADALGRYVNILANEVEWLQRIADAALIYTRHGDWAGTVESRSDFEVLCKLLGVEQ